MNEGSGLALLLVDDDARIRELVVAAAERTRLFASIATAGDGAEALERMTREARTPDLVLTDLSMPQMDGLQFVAELRARSAWREIPVVMFSSSNEPNDRERALAVGCVAFYEKPASLTGLQALLAELPRLAGPARRAG